MEGLYNCGKTEKSKVNMIKKEIQKSEFGSQKSEKIQVAGWRIQNALTRNELHGTRASKLLNEKGVALMIVLVLSFISLAIVATLIYLVIQGTRFSGFYKRYATVHDAAVGGAEMSAALILNRGNLVIPAGFDFPTGINLSPACVCGFEPDIANPVYPDPSPNTCLCRKLCLPPFKTDSVTYNWAGGVDRPNRTTCNDSVDPTNWPDILPAFNLAGVGGTQYTVFAKIIDTTVGVTDLSGEDLSCGTGAAYTCGAIGGAMSPYLYRVEINAQNAANAIERSRLSVLYAY